MQPFTLSLLALCLFLCPARALCGRPQGEPVRVAEVSARGDLILQDGRTLRLAGIEDRGDPQARSILSHWLSAQPIRLEHLTKTADRWGRFSVRAFAPDRRGALISVGEALIDAGLARVEIDPIARPCLATLLKLEEEARLAKRGLWGEMKFMPLAATDRASLLERRGQHVIVEGRVISIGQTRSQAFLNFGPYRSHDFSVVLDRAAQKSFDSTGIKISALEGMMVRVRGLLDVRWGPHIQIHDSEAVEMTRTSGAVSPKSGREP